MSRRPGIYKALQACFDTSALAKAPNLQRAETIRDLNVAEETGDVETFQTAWATLKFRQVRYAAREPKPKHHRHRQRLTGSFR
ncbi:hypothetical protein IQ273_17155 [Nodosilinea sp. LEGE 07298]|uniref:hypothetical protein n=1 Tax=Nodosilinea sp. LEGE 07298 TaxID=2777970 RepID=UPI00187E50E8|nr:hypothetical protein [Nodosilinea sp. LEGE 07298]MBE9111136.1 hypothetical protein [Nodosilinea sp. LEGE 07298]